MTGAEPQLDPALLAQLGGLEEEEAWRLIYEKAEDPAVFCEAFMKIVNRRGRLVPLEWNYPQRLLNAELDRLEKEGKPKWLIILKSRREGVSTWSEARIFERVLRQENHNGIVIAHKAKASTKLFRMTRRFYDHLPWKPSLVYSNRTELEFSAPHSSVMEIESAEDREAGRSAEYHYVHASEVAFWPDAETTMLAILQTVPNTPDSMVLIESTANGAGGYFYDTWMGAVRGENEFTPVFLPWHIDSECAMELMPGEEDDIHAEMDEIESDGIRDFGWTHEQIKWRRFTLRNKCKNDIDMFRQEYPATDLEAFRSSGRPVFDQKILGALMDSLRAGNDEPRRGTLVALGTEAATSKTRDAERSS